MTFSQLFTSRFTGYVKNDWHFRVQEPSEESVRADSKDGDSKDGSRLQALRQNLANTAKDAGPVMHEEFRSKKFDLEAYRGRIFNCGLQFCTF